MPKPKPETESAEQHRTRNEETDRKVHDFFEFWMICREKRCHRAQACIGELSPCFKRHWPLVPEEKKNWFRAFVKAWATGISKGAAALAADAEMERQRALHASLQSRGDAA
jgi:hypothetical protein